MWRLATMTPLGISISPHGPDKIQPGVPSISPDWRITLGIPSFLVSVRDISTCVSLRKGPRSAMFSKVPFGPLTVTRSWHRYCPGWLNSLIKCGLLPFPNNFSKSSCEICRCLAEVSIGILMLIYYNTPSICYLYMSVRHPVA